MARWIAATAALVVCLHLACGCSGNRTGESKAQNLRGPGLAKNRIYREEMNLLCEPCRLTLGADAAAQGGSLKISRLTEMEVLETIAGDPVRVKIVHLLDRTVTSGFESPELNSATPAALEGETEIARNVGGKWMRQLALGMPTDAQRQELGRTFSLESVYPSRPATPGDTWRLENDELGRFLDVTQGAVRGQAAFTLERMSDFEGKRCAVLTVSLQAAVSSAEPPGGQTRQLSLNGVVYRNLETGVDVQRELSGQLSISTPALTLSGPARIVWRQSVK